MGEHGRAQKRLTVYVGGAVMWLRRLCCICSYVLKAVVHLRLRMLHAIADGAVLLWRGKTTPENGLKLLGQIKKAPVGMGDLLTLVVPMVLCRGGEKACQRRGPLVSWGGGYTDAGVSLSEATLLVGENAALAQPCGCEI